MIKNTIIKILDRANLSSNYLKIYPRFWGIDKETNLQKIEELGFAAFYQIGFKSNEFYIVRYNSVELLALGINIRKENLQNGLDYLLNSHSSQITQIAMELTANQKEHQLVLSEKQDGKLKGVFADFHIGNCIHRTYNAVVLSNGNTYIVLSNGFMSSLEKFHNKMKEIYGEQMMCRLRKDDCSQMDSVCKVR